MERSVFQLNRTLSFDWIKRSSAIEQSNSQNNFRIDKIDIPFLNSVQRKVPFSSVIERSGTHERIHESKESNVDIFPF